MKPLYIFLHIPKTAGSSFIDILFTNFEGRPAGIKGEYMSGVDKTSRWSHRHEPFLDYKKHIQNPQKYDNLNCIHGHLTYPEFKGLSCFKHREKIFFTFLREPIERTISMYFFSRNNPDPQAFRKWIEDTKTEEHYTQRTNSMVYALTGDRVLDEYSLHAAKVNLMDMYFGITEYYEKSLDYFCRQFSYVFKTLRGEYKNKSKHKPRLIHRDFYDLARSYNYLDIQLYNYALKRFKRVVLYD